MKSFPSSERTMEADESWFLVPGERPVGSRMLHPGCLSRPALCPVPPPLVPPRPALSRQILLNKRRNYVLRDGNDLSFMLSRSNRGVVLVCVGKVCSRTESRHEACGRNSARHRFVCGSVRGKEGGRERATQGPVF